MKRLSTHNEAINECFVSCNPYLMDPFLLIDEATVSITHIYFLNPFIIYRNQATYNMYHYLISWQLKTGHIRTDTSAIRPLVTESGVFTTSLPVIHFF